MLRNAGPLNNTVSRLGYNVNILLFRTINIKRLYACIAHTHYVEQDNVIVSMLHYYDISHKF